MFAKNKTFRGLGAKLASLIVVMLFGLNHFSFAQEEGNVNHNEKEGLIEEAHDAVEHKKEYVEHNEEEFNPTETIMHHIADAHDFHIWGDGDHAVSMPLPIILWTNDGLVTFMSSAFHHDDEAKVVVEKNGQSFVKNHGKIYYASATANAHGQFIEMDEEHHATNLMPLDFSITKNVFSMMMSVVILLLIFTSVARAYKKQGRTSAPKGLQSFIEPIILFVREDIAKPNITASKIDKFLPYLLTIFFFIWVNNLIGLVPIFPGSANLTGNIAVTLVLAVATMIVTNVNGNKHYWGHIFWMPGIPVPMKIIMAPIELVGVLSKPFALMVRLFANITAGHIIVLSLISLIFIFKTVAIAPVSVAFVLFMDFLELLVAALQAYVFTLLSALFIGMAVDDHH